MDTAAEDSFQSAAQDRRPGRHGRTTGTRSPTGARSLVPSFPTDPASPYRSLSAPSWNIPGAPTRAPSRASFSEWEQLSGGSLLAGLEHSSEETLFSIGGVTGGGGTQGASGQKPTPGQVAARLLKDHNLPPGLLPLGSLQTFSVEGSEFTAVLGETAERELSGFRIHYCSTISGHLDMGMLVQIKGIYLWDALLHLPVRMPVRKIRAHGPEVDYVELSLGLQSIQLPKSALGAGEAGDFLWHGLPGNRDLSCSQGLAQEGDSQSCSDTQQCSGMQSHTFGALVFPQEAGGASPGSLRHRSGRASGVQRGDGRFGSPPAGRMTSSMPCRAKAHRRHHSGKAFLEV